MLVDGGVGYPRRIAVGVGTPPAAAADWSVLDEHRLVARVGGPAPVAAMGAPGSGADVLVARPSSRCRPSGNVPAHGRQLTVNPLPTAARIGMMRSMGLSHTGRVDSATLRRAGGEDAEAVADVLIRSRRAAGDAIPPPAHPDAEIRQWVRTVVIPRREVWLAEDTDGRPLGVLVLDEDWVDQLYVEADLTGLGLGSRLIELAKSRRPAGLQLWTFASNTAAQRFYLRHGFIVAETTDGTGNEEKAPDIRFAWTAP